MLWPEKLPKSCLSVTLVCKNVVTKNWDKIVTRNRTNKPNYTKSSWTITITFFSKSYQKSSEIVYKYKNKVTKNQYKNSYHKSNWQPHKVNKTGHNCDKVSQKLPKDL